MKKSVLKNMFLVVLMLSGVVMTSCKDKEAETTTTTETTKDTSATYENSTDPKDGDTVVTPTDSITETNREDKSMSTGTQVP
ncbi:MAG: hypothetical protein ACO1N9_09720 [Flavobacterium sp.]